MKLIRGAWAPYVNAKELRLSMLAALAFKPTVLTGSEVRFIRLWLEMSLSAFGRECGVSHAAVNKWEAKVDEFTRMERGTEFLIRCMVLEQLPSNVMIRRESPDSTPEADLRVYLRELRRRIVPSDVKEPIHLPVREIPNQGFLPFEVRC